MHRASLSQGRVIASVIHSSLLILFHNGRIIVRADERYSGHIFVQLCVQSLESKPLIAAVPS